MVLHVVSKRIIIIFFLNVFLEQQERMMTRNGNEEIGALVQYALLAREISICV